MIIFLFLILGYLCPLVAFMNAEWVELTIIFGEN